MKMSIKMIAWLKKIRDKTGIEIKDKEVKYKSPSALNYLKREGDRG